MKFGKYLVRFILAGTVVLAGTYGLSRLHIIDWPPQYDPLALPDLDEKPNWLTQTRLKLIDAVPENCNLALARSRARLVATKEKSAGTNCSLRDAVQLSQLSAAKIRSEDMRCIIAARLYVWERNVVQPEALKIFGEPVTEITHFGSYSCRTIRGSSYMSEHATANAFDISGFRLRSGKLISVLKDWDNGKNASFLHSVHDGLCDYFNLTLSPDYNADHKDHFHVDMGWIRGCK